ncbi:hypothetical protein [Apis mellifera associated microvirus 52]|nr:hypothetical protein [Apis mellifera associated microvirus 52]
MKKKNSDMRHYEAVDSNPHAMAVKIQRPPTLAEQIQAYMGQHNRRLEQLGVETAEEADDFDVEDEDAPESPHELVYDPLLNRELPRYQKVLIDQDRAKFDEQLADKIRADRLAAEAARRARAHLESNGGNAGRQIETTTEEPSED